MLKLQVYMLSKFEFLDVSLKNRTTSPAMTLCVLQVTVMSVSGQWIDQKMWTGSV